MILITDNEATRTTFVRTRPGKSEAQVEAEARCCEAEAATFCLQGHAGLKDLTSLNNTLLTSDNFQQCVVMNNGARNKFEDAYYICQELISRHCLPPTHDKSYVLYVPTTFFRTWDQKFGWVARIPASHLAPLQLFWEVCRSQNYSNSVAVCCFILV